jgi:hypothetical protein
MAAKYRVPILLAVVLAGGVTTGTVAMAAVETGVPALKSVARSQPAQDRRQQPAAPTNLTLTELSPGLIRLTWDPSTGPLYPPQPVLAAYDIYASASPFQLIGSVSGTVLTYTDRRSPCVKVSYYVKARDAAGNVSPPSNIVTRGRNNNKCETEDEPQVSTNLPDSAHITDKTQNSAHNTENDKQIIKADKLLHLEEADHDGGSGGHWSDSDAHGRHEVGGGPGHEGSEAYASAGNQPGGGKAGAQQAGGLQAGSHLPFTGAPVAAVAGMGGALLIAGVAGVLISVRRRRSTGAR